jgi:hypothetical protein
MSKKTVIFSTASIHSTVLLKGRPLVAQDEVGGKSRKRYSTGLLEKALELGYEVYVMTTQTMDELKKNTALEGWWMALVSEDRIFACGVEVQRESKIVMLEPWYRLFDRLGIEFPTDEKYQDHQAFRRDVRPFGLYWAGDLPELQQ